MSSAVRFKVTGFADEVSGDFETQVSTFKELGLRAIDLRSIGGVNVLDLTADQLRDAKNRALEDGIGIQCVGSPVNKVQCLPENRAAENEKLKKAIDAAHVLGIERIRIFSPETPVDRHDADAAKVLDWMAEQVEMARAAHVLLLHENDAKFWGAYPENARRLFGEFGGPHFRAAFDFANTVLIGFRPMTDWFPWILPYLDTLHIKDAVEVGSKIVVAGEGDAEMVETFEFLIARGWNGPLTLEPHLQAAGAYGGFTGPELFGAAAGALRAVLAKVGAEG